MLCLISYDLKIIGQDYSSLYSAINRLGECCHILDSTWVVKTNFNVNEVSSYLRQAIDENDRLFVVDISERDRRGWLVQEMWDWMNQHDN